MAWLAGEQDDPTRERELNIRAARNLASVRIWPKLVTVLGNLSVSNDPKSGGFLCQALWLCLRVEVPLEEGVPIAGALVDMLGPKHEAAPLAAAFAMYLVQTRGEKHHEREKLGQLALNALAACAKGRGVALEGKAIAEWIKSEKLNDPNHFIPKLSEALEALVGEDDWLFDREQVAPAS